MRPRRNESPAKFAIRVLPAAELARIGEIDRSEHVTREYVQRGADLESRPVDVHAARWSADGEGEHGVRGRVAAWQPLLERGGTLLGAFDGDRLVGFAIYQPELEPGLANLAVLHVSREVRGRGAGAALTAEVARLARADGALRLYVSATPTAATVDFYRSQGFAPTATPHPGLFVLEPDDVHMIRTL